MSDGQNPLCQWRSIDAGQDLSERLHGSFHDLTRNMYSTGLRPHRSLLFSKAHGSTDAQAIEAWLQHAVAMKIDLAPVRREQETISFVGKKFVDGGHGFRFMPFNLASPLAGVVLQLPLSRIKGIPNRNVDVFVGVVLRRQ